MHCVSCSELNSVPRTGTRKGGEEGPICMTGTRQDKHRKMLVKGAYCCELKLALSFTSIFGLMFFVQSACSYGLLCGGIGGSQGTKESKYPFYLT